MDVPCATFPPLALGKPLLCTQEMGLTLTECYYARGLLDNGGSLIVDEAQFGDMVLAIYYDIVQRAPNGPLMLQKMSLDTPFFNLYGTFKGEGCLADNFCGDRSEINYVEQGVIAAHLGQSFEEGIATINTWKKYTHRALDVIRTGNLEPFTNGPYASQETYQWYAYGFNAYINISGEEWLR